MDKKWLITRIAFLKNELKKPLFMALKLELQAELETHEESLSKLN